METDSDGWSCFSSHWNSPGVKHLSDSWRELDNPKGSESGRWRENNGIDVENDDDNDECDDDDEDDNDNDKCYDNNDNGGCAENTEDDRDDNH